MSSKDEQRSGGRQSRSMSPGDQVVHSSEPLNAEPKPHQLLRSEVTNSSQTYHRNHGPAPSDAAEAIRSHASRLDWEFELVVEPGVATESASVESTRIRLRDLRERYKQVETPIALSCAGLRRTLFAHAGPETEGIAWDESTVANAVWGGCLLREVLQEHVTGLSGDNSWHVVFESSQDCGKEEGGIFGGSIPGEVAMDNDGPVILAWLQNGDDLTLAHGGPLRVIVPGMWVQSACCRPGISPPLPLSIGARSIKWLRKITISHQPSQHHAMVSDYKQLPAIDGQLHPSEAEKQNLAEHKDELMRSAEPMQWSPMQCSVGEARLLAGPSRQCLQIKGFALGEKGVPIKEIQVNILPAPRTSDQSDNPHHQADRDEEITRQAEEDDAWFSIPIEYGPFAGRAASERPAAEARKWDGKKRWDWVLFDTELDLGSRRGRLDTDSQTHWVVVARAVDVLGHQQTRWPAWNLRGVGFDGWSVKDVEMEGQSETVSDGH